MREKGRCLFPKCKTIEQTRGLCHAHYQLAAGYIKRGKTTWEKLVKKGKARESTWSNPGHWFLE